MFENIFVKSKIKRYICRNYNQDYYGTVYRQWKFAFQTYLKQ